MMVRALWLAMVLFSVTGLETGCKKKEAGVAGSGGVAAPAGGQKVTPRKPAQTPYDSLVAMDEVWMKLQGTWLVGGSFGSSIPVIWDIRGDDVTVVGANGSEEKAKIELLAPCQAKIGSVYNQFVFDGDTLYAGLGFAGVRAGEAIVACFASGVFVHKDGKCQVHSRLFDRLETRDAKCELRKTGTSESFAATDVNRQPNPIYGTEEMPLHGNVLMTNQMRDNKAERVADLAAAKLRVGAIRAQKK